ncbi:MAG TPA: hypothetical protein VGY90_07365 [Steroidobacteraceae bacterium]|nr:hypothetical protein [Steroidobacteraceae bacterium]
MNRRDFLRSSLVFVDFEHGEKRTIGLRHYQEMYACILPRRSCSGFSG